MSIGPVTLVSACVIVLGCVGARQPKIDGESFKTSDSTGDVTQVIYPRTGRLFHADFLRDNQILRSLKRTHFRRGGPSAKRISLKRLKRDAEEGVQKKHVYVGTARIPGVDSKKDVSIKEKDIPPKAVLVKVSNMPKVDRRYRREVKQDRNKFVGESSDHEQSRTEQTTPAAKEEQTLEKNLENASRDKLKELNDTNTFSNEISPIPVENVVQEESNPVVKNNDTDKTLFIRTSIEEPSTANDAVPEGDGGEESYMRRTIVDHGLRLYPVYRGVKYYYPLTERRLLYSPQLTVQMDLPVVSETEEARTRSDDNSTNVFQEEGRSRRPLKKLVFPLLLALKLKTAIMLPLILGLISLISFKGLWSGLTALAIAAALGLKALVGGGTKVVVQPPLLPPPPHVHSHHFPPHEYAEYWSRKGDDYSDYRPTSWS